VATEAIGSRVGGLEELIRRMAIGQQSLQTSCEKIGDSVQTVRDEMFRMSLKRAAGETPEEPCPLASRAVHAKAPGAARR